MSGAMPDAQFATLLAAVQRNTASPQTADLQCRACGTPLDPVLANEGLHPTCTDIESVSDAVKRVLRAAGAAAQAARRKGPSPSGIGNPCDLALAYEAFEAPKPNASHDNHLADMGTWAHAGVAEAWELENRRLGRRRYAIEERVFLTDGISGSCDWFDMDLGRVGDHKFLGITKLREIRAGNIPPKYRIQLHLYGYGWVRAGYEVREVNLIVYPRNDNLDGAFSGVGLTIWSEPYDQQVAVDALDRLSRIVALAAQLDVEAHPERWQLIATSPGNECKYCPYKRPGGAADDSGCPGDPWS